MFIKLTKSKQFTYVQLVKGYRDGNKVKHKTILNFGRLDILQQDKTWKDSFVKLASLLNGKTEETFDINKCIANRTLNWGYVIYKKLWQIFGIDKILQTIQEKTRVNFDINNACCLMAINHLLNPHSKLGIYNNQDMYAKYAKIELNYLYRSLDILHKNKENIETAIFATNCKLYDMKIDVVFYDVTTFHFESTNKDALKDFGFSKAHKINEVQVVLGMLTDCEGRPIGYELFSGNTYEGKTLETALETIEKRFGIRNIIIVADRGINSNLNLKRIRDKGYNYIVASRIKNLKRDLEDKIFVDDGYNVINEKDIVKYKVVDYINKFKHEKRTYDLAEKLIITYSKKRALKDQKDRERLLEKARFLLADKSKIKSSNKRGGKKYLQAVGDTDWVLDKDALVRDEKFDGYYAIQTSERELNVETILEAYHTLWKIEESFRIMKSTLEVRPIFHWTEQRIRGHFVLCFLAFLLERTLEIELHKAGLVASPQTIRNTINDMQITEMWYKDKKYFLRNNLTELGGKMLQVIGIKPPNNSGLMDSLSLRKS